MPLYEYQCKKCHHTFEKIQKFSDPLVKECPKCGSAVEQLLSPPAIQFKGSGWYVTDYARRTGGNGKSGKAAESSGESKSESKPTEGKSSESKASETKPAKKD